MEHKLYRSDDNRLICGVCAGLGEYFDIDPTIIRLVFAVLSVFGGSGIVPAAICAIILNICIAPDEQ